jgi:hypothetical protein
MVQSLEILFTVKPSSRTTVPDLSIISIYILFTLPQWDFKEFRIMVHGTLSQWSHRFLLLDHETLIKF